MMRGLYIIAEGPTEEEFINNCLRHHFFDQGIFDVRPLLLSTSKGHRGGALSYGRYKDNIIRLLKQETDVLVTSLIDFFRLDTDFPRYQESAAIANKMDRTAFLEEAIRDDINHPRFLPYLQLHEFEGLLFSASTGFDNLPDIPAANRQQLATATRLHSNPEMLNDGPATAPSKRLQQFIPGYQKVLHGSWIAMEITLPVILSRCERFRQWTESLTLRMRNG